VLFQALEMFMAGYNFHILNNAFVSHRGLQEFHDTPDWRIEQRTANEFKFASFAKELVARYDRDPLRMLAKLKAFNVTEIVYRYMRDPPLFGYEQ